MDKKLFLELADFARASLCHQNIKDAIKRMESMLYLLPDSRIESELCDLSNAFEGLLNCLRKGIKDENRTQSFHQMHTQLWHLFLDLMHKFKCEQTTTSYRKANDKALFKMPYWIFNKELEEIAINKKDSDNEHVVRYTSLFEQLWTTTKLSQIDYKELHDLLNNEKLLLEDRLLAVSALMLSAIEYPESQKLALLTELCQSETMEIQVRAMVGMTILTFMTESYGIYGKELEQFGQIMAQEGNQDKLCLIIQGLHNAIHTPKFNQEFNQKMLSQLRKQQEQSNKLPAKQDSPQIIIEFRAMQERMDESAQKIKEMTKKGRDLYFSLYRRFKSFAFFQNMANWFYPFTKTHCHSAQAFSGRPTFLDVFIESCPFCDSDKWSIFFLVQSSKANLILPEGMEPDRSQLPPKSWDSICFNYIFDLYRFYFCCSGSVSCPSPFQADIIPCHHPAIYNQLDSIHQLYLAQVLMENEEYEIAIDIFKSQPTLELRNRKMLAICFQRLGEYTEAIRYYRECLAEKDETRVKKNLVTCYKKLEKWEQAAILLDDLAETDTKNTLKHEMQRAICLMNLGKYEEALQLLYKVEYMQNNQMQALRCITWCNLQIKYPTKSLRYWQKIKEKNNEDWLKGGHIYWALGDVENAYNCYLKFLTEAENEEKAIRCFMDDVPTLKQYAITQSDINLMLQALSH